MSDRSVSADPSRDHLMARLGVVQRRVRAAVAHRRAGDSAPDDQFRGLYVSEEEVDRLLDVPRPLPPDDQSAEALVRMEKQADEAEAEGAELRLRRLARSFRLEDLDVEILLIAMAPDLDPRFERLYGYLHDDISRRRPSTGLALELSGVPFTLSSGRRRFDRTSPLLEGGLVFVEDGDRPFLTRSLRVPDRVTAHLMGDNVPDQSLIPLAMPQVTASFVEAEQVVRAFRGGIRLCYFREQAGSSGHALGIAVFSMLEWGSLPLDLNRLAPGEDLVQLAITAGREARLRGMGLVVGPVDGLATKDPTFIRRLGALRWPVVLTGEGHWDPAWSTDVPLVIDAPAPDEGQRAAIWRRSLNGSGQRANLDPVRETAQFRLTPDQVFRAAAAARIRASAAGRELDASDIRAGVRAQNAAGLGQLARRIEPAVGWDDLVLPAETVLQLRELTARSRHRELVLRGWRLHRGSAKGEGITALFAGESGTGKTMAAEVVAGDLGLELYVIDLSTVVDKYIGETEKNLDRVFAQAEGINALLLFDEADALFGKRSEVSDARDRYANLEVAYLLQRMELFDGIAVLTTNLRANLDDAFTRRLDAVIDFPLPEEEDRHRLWEATLGTTMPRMDDLDVDFLARSFKLSGGNIRNIVLAAAYFAAESGRPVCMADLIRGTHREYRKLGRLVVESEFGVYYPIGENSAR